MVKEEFSEKKQTRVLGGEKWYVGCSNDCLVDFNVDDTNHG